MAEDRSITLLDYVLILLKWKKFLLAVFLSSLILSYSILYFFVDEEFDSTALILPLEDTSLGGISGVMKNLKDLPLGLGGSSKTASTDLYITLIYSRTNLESLIKRFDLKNDYEESSLEEAIKILTNKITCKETKENAFTITVRTISRAKSVEMVNYIVEYLNSKVIQLNVSKSRDNRLFLEGRYNELKKNLKDSEDSLQYYQQKSGLFEAKEQIKLIAEAYSELEVERLTKESQLQIIKNLYGINSTQYLAIQNEFDVLNAQLNSLKSEGKSKSLILPLNSLPEKAKIYIRYYRDVEILNKIMEFIVPLYEQAKIEEQKSIPVFQIIDHGIRPEKKAYPPRTLFAALTAFIVAIITMLVILIRESWINSTNPKIVMLKNDIHFKIKNK